MAKNGNEALLRPRNGEKAIERNARMASTNQNILLVDDDKELCAIMAEFFAPYEFRIDFVHDGSRGLARALENSCDLVILDVMLPDLDGLEVLNQLRRRSSVPVLLLTARVDHQSRIAGFEAGADDYLCKPFSPDELLVRVRAILRRASRERVQDGSPIRLGELSINPENHEVWDQSQRIEVTGIEFDILAMLMRSGGKIVSRDQITAALYQRLPGPFERSIDVHISRLRKKLEANPRISIRSIRGIGYMMAVAGMAEL